MSFSASKQKKLFIIIKWDGDPFGDKQIQRLNLQFLWQKRSNMKPFRFWLGESVAELMDEISKALPNFVIWCLVHRKLARSTLLS
jgi:hypothetical protein